MYLSIAELLWIEKHQNQIEVRLNEATSSIETFDLKHFLSSIQLDTRLIFWASFYCPSQYLLPLTSMANFQWKTKKVDKSKNTLAKC